MQDVLILRRPQKAVVSPDSYREQKIENRKKKTHNQQQMTYKDEILQTNKSFINCCIYSANMPLAIWLRKKENSGQSSDGRVQTTDNPKQKKRV